MCYKILSGVTLSCNFKSSSWCMLFRLFTCVLHNFRIKNTPHSSIKWCLSQDKAWKFQQSYEPRPPLSWLIYNQNTSHQSHWRKGLGRVKRRDNRNFNIMWFIKRSFIFFAMYQFYVFIFLTNLLHFTRIYMVEIWHFYCYIRTQKSSFFLLCYLRSNQIITFHKYFWC